MDFSITAKPEVKHFGHLNFLVSMVYTTTVPNLVLLERFEPNDPFASLTCSTNSGQIVKTGMNVV